MKALVLMVALAGCSPAPVSLSFSGATTTQVGIGYTNTSAGLATESETELVLTTAAGGASFRMAVDPIKEPTTVNIGERHLSIEYSLMSSGWASNGGSVTLSSVSPYEVTFNDIEMLAATSGAKGKFVLGGTATFKK